jgi:hypothetical protein
VTDADTLDALEIFLFDLGTALLKHRENPNPCPYGSPDHLDDLDCPACQRATERTAEGQ